MELIAFVGSKQRRLANKLAQEDEERNQGSEYLRMHRQGRDGAHLASLVFGSHFIPHSLDIISLL